MNPVTIKPSCIILAGGEGKRMDGSDKGLVLYKDMPLIESVIEKIKLQVDDIIISANRNMVRYERFGYPVITDSSLIGNDKRQYNGPLAGIAAALSACANEWVFVIACDMPLVSDTIVTQLVASLKNNDTAKKNIAVAEVSEKLQLAILLNKSLLPTIEHALKKNQLKLMQWIKSNQTETVTFSSENEFKNFNYFKDLL